MDTTLRTSTGSRVLRGAIAAILSGSLSAFSVGTALAFPGTGTLAGGALQGGATTITGTASTVITQTTPRVWINWDSYSVAVGQSVTYNTTLASGI
ncbi:MAG: hypothetical protein NTZ79_17845, partial [Proteobacteria bacterium]|nr:hypothetical protein [Pseudomonadota bacterium]